jgi:hypothetical protein
MTREHRWSVFEHPRLVGLVIAGMCLVVYLLTLSRTVGFIDGGELAAVACTLGVAHPTGYPLFTLLGRLFIMLPLPWEEIVRLNLMAALLCAASVFVFFQLSLILLEPVARRFGVSPPLRFAASGGASLLMGFSETWWSQAVSAEVYALHMLLATTTVLVFFRAAEDRREALWYAGAFLLGLSFTNHMTTILLVPGLVHLYFARFGSHRSSWNRLLRLLPVFVSGLSLYVYLPLRAAVPPALNWGDPSTLERLFWHLRGKQYSVWIFSSTEVTGRQLTHFLTALPGEFAYIGLIAAVIGLVVLWRASRKGAITTMLFCAVCVLYAVNYDIQDIDSYFLLAYIMIGLWTGCGLLAVGHWWIGVWGWSRTLVAALLLLSGVLSLGVHYRGVDQSGNRLVEDYTRNMFHSLAPNALVLSYQWDYWVSASYYYQNVKSVRRDVLVVDKELLRRSWYLRELEVQKPWLIHSSQGEVDAFRQELEKFEKGVPYNPAVIQARFVEMITGFIKKSRLSRPVYVTAEIESEFTPGYQRVPEGLAFRLESDTSFHEPRMPELVVRPLERKGRLEDMIWRLYAEAFFAHGEYLLRAGRVEGAQKAYRFGVFYDPTFPAARARLRMLGE